MANIFVFVKDSDIGKPVQNARVHGQYHWGAATGSGSNAFDGLTDSDGRFPIGVSASWFGDMQADFDYTVDANGYDSDNFKQHLGGITGDYTLPAVTIQRTTIHPLPGAGPIAGASGDIGRQGQSLDMQLKALGTTTAIVLVVVAVAVLIGLVVLAYLLGPGSLTGAAKGGTG